MLDQNIATLLAALVGGLLSAVGGFLANYYVQSSTNKVSKRKEIRNTLEKAYKKTQSVYVTYEIIGNNLFEPVIFAENVEKIADIMVELEFLVNFYLPPLNNSFLIYSTYMGEFTQKCASKMYSDIKKYYEKSELRQTTNNFQASIIELFKKEGYNYF